MEGERQTGGERRWRAVRNQMGGERRWRVRDKRVERGDGG